MIRQPWWFVVGLGMAIWGAAGFAANQPPGDVFWEWPVTGLIVSVAGLVMLGSSLSPGEKTDKD